MIKKTSSQAPELHLARRPSMGRALSMIARRPVGDATSVMETAATETAAPIEQCTLTSSKKMICSL